MVDFYFYRRQKKEMVRGGGIVVREDTNHGGERVVNGEWRVGSGEQGVGRECVQERGRGH